MSLLALPLFSQTLQVTTEPREVGQNKNDFEIKEIFLGFIVMKYWHGKALIKLRDIPERTKN